MSKFFRKGVVHDVHNIYFVAIAPVNEYLDM
jgi:hypothetical protein